MTAKTEKTGWLQRLRSGLQRSSSKLGEGITGIFTKRKLDAAMLAELEDVLITADLGPTTASKLVAEFGRTRFGKDIDDDEVKRVLAEQIAAILKPCAVQLHISPDHKPFVVMMVGVNGVGKTTTIGKLAQHYARQGLRVIMAAGDTFRAAAISQLKIWGERTGAVVIAGEQGGDAASLAFQALEKANATQADLLLIDTAGRLHNKNDLMQELAKIARVLQKLDSTAPHAVLLVLDATTGQNAHAQVEAFGEIIHISGLVVTKLDGSAKGGVLVALADRFKLPIHAIGVGESADDLQSFNADEFAQSLMGLGE
jgi:fused signal recognition particle receptor